jgi:hypothetical protein
MSTPDMEAGLSGPTIAEAAHDMSRFVTEPQHRAFLGVMGAVIVLQEGPEWLRATALIAGTLLTARHLKSALLGW